MYIFILGMLCRGRRPKDRAGPERRNESVEILSERRKPEHHNDDSTEKKERLAL